MENSNSDLAVSYDGYYTTDGVTAYIYGTDSYYVDLTKERYGTAVNIDATNSFGEHYLYGDEAANLIVSGSNASTLWGGLDYANDILVGGWSYDTFYYGKNEGTDTILNASAIDTVDLYDAATSDIVSVSYNGNASGGTLGLYFNTGNAVFVAYSGEVSPTFTTYDNRFAFDSATQTWRYPSESVTQETSITGQQVNWSSVPRFDNYTTLVNYIDNCKYNLQTMVPVVCVGFVPEESNVLLNGNMIDFSFDEYANDGQSHYLLCDITNYAGERVAYAYTHGNTSFLTAEELQLYNVGVQIVNEAKNFSSDPLYRELYIHDQIKNRTIYYSEDPQPKYARFKSALGALIDGKANCQGYTDAFYMLGTMCGLDVGKTSGWATAVEKGGHQWNTITFGNTSYFVDMTWDDDQGGSDDYYYFNAPTAVMSADHSWSPYYVPQNMQTYPDALNFYHAQEYNTSNGQYFGTWAYTAEDALNLIAYRIASQGYNTSRVEAPFDYYYSLWNCSADYLKTALNNMNFDWSSRSVWLNVKRLGNYMYYTVTATPY